MARIAALAALLVLAVAASTATAALTAADRQRFASLFRTAAASQSAADVAAGAQGLLALGESVPSGACDVAKKADDGSLGDLYQAALIANAAKCKVSFSNAASTLKKAMSENTEAKALFHAVFAAKTFGVAVDGGVKDKLESVFANSYTVLGAGYAFRTAALLDLSAEDLSVFTEAVEDVFAQADVTDDEDRLWFEGGTGPTSVIVRGVYELAQAANSEPGVENGQVTAVAAFLLDAKWAAAPSSASNIVAALATLANNAYGKPTFVYSETTAVSDTGNGDISVHLVDAVGKDVTSDFTIKASIKGTKISGKQLTKAGAAFKLSTKDAKLTRGIYEATFTATPSGDSKYIESEGEHTFKVTGKVDVSTAEIKIHESNVKAPASGTKLSYPKKASSKFVVDDHSKVLISFKIVDQATKKVTEAHQVFVRFTGTDGTEVFFVAEAGEDGVYLFDLDVAAVAKDSFNSQSGEYAVAIIIGDATIDNSIEWEVGTAVVTFRQSEPVATPASKIYKKRDNIEHMFREPEKRPPAIVSTVFTGLVLAPIAVLLILWVRLDANIKGFPWSSLPTLGFHIGLGSILLLFVAFWVSLNLFETAQYLVVLGTFTAVMGKFALNQVHAKHASS